MCDCQWMGQLRVIYQPGKGWRNDKRGIEFYCSSLDRLANLSDVINLTITHRENSYEEAAE